MFLIEQVTDDSKQKRTLILPDGSQIQLSIYFIPMQFGWFITELIYKDFTLQGLRITNSPNMLHQFKNQLPFGIACFSKEDREPSQSQDFSSAASQLFVLDSDEIEEYQDFLSG